ncbi:MAG: hypothetical protein R3F46_03275 [bacterium]
MDQVQTASGTVNDSQPVSRLRLMRMAAHQLALPIQPLVIRICLLMAGGMLLSAALAFWHRHLDSVSPSYLASQELLLAEVVVVICYALLLAGIAAALSQNSTPGPVISLPMHQRLLAIARGIGQLENVDEGSVRAVVSDRLDNELSPRARSILPAASVLICLGLLTLNIAMLRELAIRCEPLLPGSAQPAYAFSFLQTQWLAFTAVVMPMFSMLVVSMLVLLGNGRVFCSRSLWLSARELRRDGQLSLLLPDIRRELKGASYRIGNLQDLSGSAARLSGEGRADAASLKSLAAQQARLEQISEAGRRATSVIIQRRGILRIALAAVTAVMLFQAGRLILNGGLSAFWLLSGLLAISVIAILCIFGYNIPPDRRLAYSFDLLAMRLLLHGNSFDDLQVPASHVERILLPELRKRDLDATLLGLALLPEYYSSNVRTSQSQHHTAAGAIGFVYFLVVVSALGVSPLLGVLLIASLLLQSFIRQLSASAILGDYIEQVVPMYRSQLQLDGVPHPGELSEEANQAAAAPLPEPAAAQAGGDTPLGNLAGSMKLRIHDEDMQRIREAFKADVHPLKNPGAPVFLFIYWLMLSERGIVASASSSGSSGFPFLLFTCMAVVGLITLTGLVYNRSTMPRYMEYCRSEIDSRMLILRLVSGEIKRDEVISSSIPIFGYFHRFPQVQEGPARALRDAAISLVVDHSWHFRPRQNYLRPAYLSRYLSLLLLLGGMWLTKNLMFSAPLVLLAVVFVAVNMIQQQRTAELADLLVRELESLTETG